MSAATKKKSKSNARVQTGLNVGRFMELHQKLLRGELSYEEYVRQTAAMKAKIKTA